MTPAVAQLDAQLLPWFIAASGLFGLLIGSFLNVVVWRVPRGESLLPDSHCPHCDAPIRPWQNVPVVSWLALRGACASCGARISSRYPLVEVGTAIAFALVAWWVAAKFGEPGPDAADAIAWWAILVAYLWFAAVTIALALIDIDHQRLPDAIVLPSAALVIVLLSVAAIASGDWGRLIATIGSAAALFVGYLLIAVVYPRGIGGGDVKLAPLLGAVLGFIGLGATVVGSFAGFVLGAMYGIVLMLAGRATRKSGIPFGPFMLAGAWIGLVLGEAISRWYLALAGLT